LVDAQGFRGRGRGSSPVKWYGMLIRKFEKGPTWVRLKSYLIASFIGSLGATLKDTLITENCGMFSP